MESFDEQNFVPDFLEVNNLLIFEKHFFQENRWKKRGLTLVMMSYPYNIMYNYHILISVYAFDGTVSISHGGVEIGQGINTKVRLHIIFK